MPRGDTLVVTPKLAFRTGCAALAAEVDWLHGLYTADDWRPRSPRAVLRPASCPSTTTPSTFIAWSRETGTTPHPSNGRIDGLSTQRPRLEARGILVA